MRWPDASPVAIHPWDVQGAIRAGLEGAWVDRERYPEVFDPPHTQAATFGEVVEAFIEV